MGIALTRKSGNCNPLPVVNPACTKSVCPVTALFDRAIADDTITGLTCMAYQFFHVLCGPSITPAARTPGAGRGVIDIMVNGSQVNTVQRMAFTMSFLFCINTKLRVKIPRLYRGQFAAAFSNLI